MERAIVSVLGKDKPGIIAAVTKILFEQDCNIESVSQTILHSEFSGLFIIAMPGNMTPRELSERMRDELKTTDLHVFVKWIETTAASGPEKTEPFVVTTEGPDNKGLVAGITAIMAAHKVNVAGLQALFKGGTAPEDNIMIYHVDVPEHIDQQSLRNELRKKAEQLDLTISIQHKRIFEAINRI
ncbi:MAG: ACT domain-containing protein [Desulfobacteraceae bacterium]|nr:ACT domain-containing protein [Desulfobacteraceae bacterium]